MTEYKIISNETMERMMQCFSNHQEFRDMGLSINQMQNELMYLGMQMSRDKEERISMYVTKQIMTLALYCRSNMELIQQLVSVIEFETITEEQLRKLEEEGGIEKGN